ncbi:MAG TPA: hypothetical protein VIM62_09060 [Acidobacteriaceae bacterium]
MCKWKGYLAATVLLVSGAITMAADKKIAKSELPEAVRKSADGQSAGATVKGYGKEVEDGKLLYEVRLTANGHNKDISIAPDGAVLEIEEEVKLAELPASVQHGLQAKAGAGRIARVESLSKHGALVAHEAQVEKGGRLSEVQVGPDGKTSIAKSNNLACGCHRCITAMSVGGLPGVGRAVDIKSSGRLFSDLQKCRIRSVAAVNWLMFVPWS